MAPVAHEELKRLLDDRLSDAEQKEILTWVDDIEVLKLPGKPTMILTGWVKKGKTFPDAATDYANEDGTFKVWTYATAKKQGYTLMHSYIAADPSPRPQQVNHVYCQFVRDEYREDGYDPAVLDLKPSELKKLPRTVIFKCWKLATGETLENNNNKKKKTKRKGPDGDPGSNKRAKGKDTLDDDHTEESDAIVTPVFSEKNFEQAKPEKKKKPARKQRSATVSADTASEDAEGTKKTTTDDNPPKADKGKAPVQDEAMQDPTNSDGSIECDADHEVWKAFMAGEPQDNWEEVRKAYTAIFKKEAPSKDIFEEAFVEIQAGHANGSPLRKFKQTAAYSRWTRFTSGGLSGGSPIVIDGDEKDRSSSRGPQKNAGSPTRQPLQQVSDQNPPEVETNQIDSHDHDGEEPKSTEEAVELSTQRPSPEVQQPLPKASSDQRSAEVETDPIDSHDHDGEEPKSTEEAVELPTQRPSPEVQQPLPKTSSDQRSAEVETDPVDSHDHDGEELESTEEAVGLPPQQSSPEASSRSSRLFVTDESESGMQQIGELPQIPEDVDLATSAALINQIDGLNLPDDHPIFNSTDYERLINTVRAHRGLTSLEELYRVSIWEDVLDESGRLYR